MAVPTTGSFLMFGTGSNATIAGAIIEGGANSETIASTLNFNTLKSLADINKFDVEFKEGATTLEQIVKSTQFRGYPIFKCNFNGLTIVCDSTTTTTTISPCGFNGLTVICDSITTTTTTTEAPTTTTTTQPCFDCYVYEYINNSSNIIALNGTLCSGGAYSINVTPSEEGATFCIQQLSQGTIDAYAALGLILTEAAVSCGNSCTPTTTTTTTTLPTTTTTTTTASPTTTTTTTEGPLYYTLNSCNPGDPLYDTTITPILTNQRYVDPISGNFWVWDNAAGTSSPQQTVNSSLQIVSGQSGCP
jgi:hypothetical protein